MRPGPRTVLLNFVGAALLAPAVAVGQAAPPPAPPTPQPSAAPVVGFRTDVVVTAERAVDERERVAVATSVVTREQLESRPAATFADAVQMMPGFQILFTDASGMAPTSIARGFFGGGEAEYVRVLLDGVPLGDAESGLVDWRRVPAFAINRVEAVRGPASALYGDTALGGVIQLFTATPTRRAGRLTAGGGSFGSASAGTEFGQPIGSVTLQALGSFNHTDGARAHSRLQEGFASVSLRHAGSSRLWTARGVFNHSDRDEPGALTGLKLAADRKTSDPQFRFDHDTTHRAYGAVRYGASVGPLTLSLLGNVSARNGNRVRTLLLAPELGDRARRNISTRGAGTSVENSLATSFWGISGQLRFGLDVSRDHVDTRYHSVSDDGVTGADASAAVGRRWQLAGYATQSVAIGSRATVHAGLRWDTLRDRFSENRSAKHEAWSPRVGGLFFIGAETSIFAQASRAFKSPTLDQLFDPRLFPAFNGATFLISTPLLRPQRAMNVESGIRQTADRYRWEAVIYRMNVRDEIDFDPATFAYANIGRSVHQGIEIDTTLLDGSRVAVAANYTFTRVAAAGAAESRQLKNIPRHVFRPDVTVTLPSHTTLHARYTRTAGAYADDENKVPLGSRSTIDVRIAKRFARVTARVDLLNITNDRYEEVGYALPDFRGGVTPFYYPAPGFAARAGLELTF